MSRPQLPGFSGAEEALFYWLPVFGPDEFNHSGLLLLIMRGAVGHGASFARRQIDCRQSQRVTCSPTDPDSPVSRNNLIDKYLKIN
jgi:hypothetical protein